MTPTRSTRAKRDGSDIRPLSKAPGYNAESTISRDGKHIVFTSTRNGDIDIYTMDADGSHVKQLTHELGYDGGPFWSYDGKKIVYRAEHPKTPEQIKDYKDLLARGLIRPGNLELWVMNADGSDKRQVTHNGAANFGPYWLPDGKRIIFASNMGDTKDPSGFDLYVINEDGTGLERITYYPGFDAFPMFSSDGKKLVWSSNRNGRAPHETNIFIADWVNYERCCQARSRSKEQTRQSGDWRSQDFRAGPAFFVESQHHPAAGDDHRTANQIRLPATSSGWLLCARVGSLSCSRRDRFRCACSGNRV